jgi:hypothetical protein
MSNVPPLSIMTLFAYAYCCYAVCHSFVSSDQVHYDKCHCAECRYAERHSTECHYAACCYAECDGINIICRMLPNYYFIVEALERFASSHGYMTFG